MTLTVTGTGPFYVIDEATGAQLGGAHSDRYTAWAACDRRQHEAKCTVRACLCCGSSFESEGPHNRLCDPCRTGGDVVLPTLSRHEYCHRFY